MNLPALPFLCVTSHPVRSAFVRHGLLFPPLLSWALLRANSCVLRLRGFCFPGSSLTPWFPPRMQPLALEAEALALGAPGNGAKKEKRKCLTSIP